MKLCEALSTAFESKENQAGESPYPTLLRQIRRQEYPDLQQTTYLDHAGTTPPPKSAINAFAKDLTSNLFGNPHSASPASKLTTEKVEKVRLQVLAFVKADPKDFDLIFVANATAAVKLLVECVIDYSLEQRKRQVDRGFWYGYHKDCHTSLVGPREVADSSQYFDGDDEVERWLSLPDIGNDASVGIFAYPAQSNMNGRRLPLDWPGRLRRAQSSQNLNIFSLLDAAAYVATAQLDLSNEEMAPDFTAFSFYKIFGFPDLGALIVRKKASNVLSKRRYLGGGTVEMVINSSGPALAWHARKQSSLHAMLEDGTPPFHTIIALESAMETHRSLFGSMTKVSQHTSRLVKILHGEMAALYYLNGQSVCSIYKDKSSTHGDSKTQGPTVAFNIKDRRGHWIGKTQFEHAAIKANIQLRTGGVCNPGGIASALGLSPVEMRANFAEGVRCGNEVDEMQGKPTGIVRVSLGAMSNLGDIRRFLEFLKWFAETQGGPTLSLHSAGQGALIWKGESLPSRTSSNMSSIITDKSSAFPTVGPMAEYSTPPKWRANSEASLTWKRLCLG